VKQLPARFDHRALVSSVVAATALVAACGTAYASPGATGTAAAASQMTIGTRQTSIGTVLTGPSGRTLYTLVDNQGKAVACSGGCLAVWPPATMDSGSPQAGSGVTASLSTVAAGGGTLQLTVSGDPVDYYVGDTSAGQANGEGISSYGGDLVRPAAQWAAIHAGERRQPLRLLKPEGEVQVDALTRLLTRLHPRSIV
jgi:predicted lipoprotein with Yx(FWY)xxD motif